jgi:hypothetical protein
MRKTNHQEPPPVVRLAEPTGKLIPATHFETVSFFEKVMDRQVVLIYALGADGIIREYSNGKWNEFPITAGP